MKNTKLIKIVAVAMMGVLAMGALTGCGSKKDAIIMGTNAAFEPFEYIKGTDVVGFDVELAKIIADKLGKELVIQDMEFAQLLGAVDTGKIDFIAAGMTATPERAEQVDFTKGYFQSKQVIIVKEGEDSITTADDLVGKKVGVQLGTTGDLFVSGVDGIEVRQYDKAALAVADLVNSKVNAVVIDAEPAKKIVENYDNVKVLDAPFIEEEYAIAVKKGNTELLTQIDQVLDEIVADGTYDKLFEEFFGAIEE